MSVKVLATWKAGMGLFKADAQRCAEEILSIGEEATAKQIVDKARNTTTELHKCFEWNDATAAEKYRIEQARDLVANLVIVRTQEQVERNEPEIRVFHKPTSQSGYKPIQVIIQNKDEYQELLKRAYAELTAFKMKYANLQELDYILRLIP
jgi:hypothetical protein